MNSDTFRDNVELRLFLQGMKFLLGFPNDLTRESEKFMEHLVHRCVDIIKSKEERVDDDSDNRFLKEKLNEIDAERTFLLLDFCFNSDLLD